MSVLLLLLSTVLLFVLGGARAQDRSDPYRPPCQDARCGKIKAFLKSNVCGRSPFGKGPEDGCDIQNLKHSNAAEVIADYVCDWAAAGKRSCKQQTMPSLEVRKALERELVRVGLPADAAGSRYFRVWRAKTAGWLLAEVYYFHRTSEHEDLCQVIAVIGQASEVSVLREHGWTRTLLRSEGLVDWTPWTPAELADVDGDGQIDVVIKADADENHWLEVFSRKKGVWATVFSGLGYFL